MAENSNWNFSNDNFNLFKNKDNIEDGDNMFQIIDNAKKNILKEIFETGIKINYDNYKEYLFETNLFLFGSLEKNIEESVYCLIIGAYTASITNTNLILERAIKLALMQFNAKDLLNFSNDDLIQKYIESDRKFSGKNLDQNIQTCQSFKIFTEEEAKELKEYKLKFRDGFSHFTPKNILKGEKSLFNIPGVEKIDEKMSIYLKLPTYQAAEVMQFAINNAENHLKYVLKIINHLQFKILDKFSQK